LKYQYRIEYQLRDNFESHNIRGFN